MPNRKEFEEWLLPPDAQGCRIFTGHKMKNGYGTVRRNNPRRKVLAHRLAYELAYGAIPEGMHVLHRCDVRSCCEPTHLFLGTNQDNIADRVAKGRSHVMRGTDSPRAKLSAEAVSEIRSTPYVDSRILAEKFGVKRNTIYVVRRGDAY